MAARFPDTDDLEAANGVLLIAGLGFVTFVVGLFRVAKPNKRITRPIGGVIALGGFVWFCTFMMIYDATPAGKAANAARNAQKQSVADVKSDEKAKGDEKAKAAAQKKAADEAKLQVDLAKVELVQAKRPVVEFTGAFDPTVLRVGEKLVIKLGIDNKGTEDINGFSVFSSGSQWKKFTIVNMIPGGTYDVGAMGTRFTSPKMQIPVGQKLYFTVIAYPNEPGNYDLSFIPRDGQDRKMVNTNGEEWIIGGKIGVIR